MNQILVSEKLYVTPDMKKKKKFYKMEFFISVFLICLLTSYGIYAEYDRNKSEDVSQEIMANMSFKEPEPKTVIKEESIVIILNKPKKQATEQVVEEVVEEQVPEVQMSETSNGEKYYTVGTINIPSINVNYPILSETSVELLKISPCKFWGPNPNEVRKFLYSRA